MDAHERTSHEHSFATKMTACCRGSDSLARGDEKHEKKDAWLRAAVRPSGRHKKRIAARTKYPNLRRHTNGGSETRQGQV